MSSNNNVVKMDPKLEEAAESGYVSFLKKAIASQPLDDGDYSYFLSLSYWPNGSDGHSRGNILHLATWRGKVKFFKEAMESLPPELILILLSQRDQLDANPLHVAAYMNKLEIVKLILGFYKSYTPPRPSPSPSPLPIPNNDDDLHKPWLALSHKKMTPLHIALKLCNEEPAMEILSMDMELLCTMVDNEGNSPLFLAVRYGCNQVAAEILVSDFSYSTSGACGSTPLHVVPYSSAEVFTYLLACHEDLFDVVDDEGYNMLHRWADIGDVWPLTFLLNEAESCPVYTYLKEKLKEEFTAARSEVFRDLITYTTEKHKGDSPLHIAAASKEREEFLRALVRGSLQEMRAVATSSESEIPHCSLSPWRVQNNDGDTPLHTAIKNGNQVHALHFLSTDPTLCHIINDQGESPLFLAIKMTSGFINFYQFIEKILNMNYLPFSTLHCSHDGVTLLHLLSGCPANRHSLRFVKKLVKAFIKELRSSTTNSELPDCSPNCPWRIKDNHGNTPLHTAIENGNQEHALYFLSIGPTVCHILNNQGESPLFLAAKMTSHLVNFDQLIEEILRRMHDCPFSKLHCSHDGVTLLHLLPRCSEKIGKRLLEKFWWMMNLRDTEGRTALDKAKEENIPWLVNLLSNPLLIQKEPFNCFKPNSFFIHRLEDEAPAALVFIDACREQNENPLNHIKLKTHADYVKFLKIPSVANYKNVTDSEGASPLHRALLREDMLLAEALLNDGTTAMELLDKLYKEDNHGTTAMELLDKLYKENDDWANMCKKIKVYPYLRTLYIKPGTNMGEMRRTLSTVAALLATIMAALLASVSFAAGFTLTGGFDSKTGDAVSAKKAAFLVFILSDGYALCTSMLVLFLLIWSSMVSTRDMSDFLVDRSVLIIKQALYGTMVAFMTGICAVIAYSSLWAVIIIIFGMCFVFGILANRTFLFNNVFPRFSHLLFGDQSENEVSARTRLLEEGKAFGCTGDDN